jgi:hypothetical protein
MEIAMSAAVAKRKCNESWITPSGSRRREVLARYRHLREISRRRQGEAVDFLSHDAVSLHARRIGLAFGRARILKQASDPTYTFDLLLEASDLAYAVDLALHTAPPGRIRVIDRYSRTTQVAPDSDEALMLMAMRNSSFTIIRVERVHATAGLIVEDVYRRKQIWLVDEAMERSVPRGLVIATRLYTPESFSMTAGVGLPLDPGMLRDMLDDVPQLDRNQLEGVVNDYRFMEAVYRIAIERGVTERIGYKDPLGGARPDGMRPSVQRPSREAPSSNLQAGRACSRVPAGLFGLWAKHR